MRTRTAAMVAGLVLLAGCGGPDAGTQRLEAARLGTDVEFVGDPSRASDADQVAAASVRLAVHLVDLGDGEDVVASPLSLQLALAVLREGATGEAEPALAEVLGLSGVDGRAVADLRARLDRFAGDVADVDREAPPDVPLVHVAGAVFVQPGWPVEEDFLVAASAHHRARVYEADFEGGQARRLLDAWVARETGGLLEQAPAEPSTDTRVTLLDAVVLAAAWASPFDPAATFDAPFTTGDGATVQVSTMHQMLPTRYAEGTGWRAVDLPYTEGFAMRVVLPDESGTVLGEAEWSTVHAGLAAASGDTLVTLAMPRWATDATLDLTPLLGTLGLADLLRPGSLEELFEDAFVSQVAQSATITVAERGTVAAAVTQVDAAAGSAPPEPEVELLLDRPFEYHVVERATGLVLFAGRVADPR